MTTASPTPTPIPSRAPVAKVTAATAGAAVATLIILIIQWITGDQPPVGIEGALATVLAFVSGYLAPPKWGSQS